jgi:hypothetical protein
MARVLQNRKANGNAKKWMEGGDGESRVGSS